MIPDKSLDLHKGMKDARKDKYVDKYKKYIFFIFLNIFKMYLILN